MVDRSYERRYWPRFEIWAACSVLPRLSDNDRRQHAVLGSVKDLSRDAVAILFPSNETYGVDDSSLGRQVEITLGLPVGYIRLSATLFRYSLDETSGKHLAVFKIQKSKERNKYLAYLDSLQSSE